MGKASDLYLTGMGTKYHARNRLLIAKNTAARRLALRSFFPHHVNKAWLEVGCGTKGNMMPHDVGVDIDPRLKPDHVASALDLPFEEDQFAVVFCVGLLMHLPDGEWQRVVDEMIRVAKYAIIIGEYYSEEETDLSWNPETGTFGDGEPGLVWARPYPSPLPRWRAWHAHRAFPEAFGEEVEFFTFVRE